VQDQDFKDANGLDFNECMYTQEQNWRIMNELKAGTTIYILKTQFNAY
jgi:hypothetical protein